jgi:chromosome segregation protein
MTYIKRLELRHFKSSGMKPLVVNFEKGFNVITGPNGSGKSNIADAIIFVLGENSPKLLRAAGGKLTGLIYDPRREEGSPESQKPGYCRVTIQFDNLDREIPIDSDTVTVSRELREDGENVYYLNGRKVTRSSLVEILDIAGLSSDGLNIVPQGAATRVADLSPEDKRKLIEEIVGISKFDEKKAEAQRQLSQADQRLEVAMARIGEMKSYLEQLDTQRNELVKMNVLESQLNWLRAVITSKRITEVRTKIDDLSREEKDIEEKIQDASKKLEELDKKIATVEEERTRFIVEVVQGGGKSHIELQLQLAQVTNELDTITSELKEAEISVAQLERETIPSLKEAVANKEREVSHSNALIGQLSSEIEKLELKRKDLVSKLDEIAKAQSLLRETMDKNARKAARIQEKIKELSERLNNTEISINGVAVALNSERKRLQELKERVDGYSSVLVELESNMSKLSEIYADATENLRKIESSISSLDSRKEKILSLIEAASRVLEKAGEEIYKSRALVSVKKEISESEEEKKLRELCESGGVPGYVGVLGKMISFKREHSEAVKAILGQNTNCFIVENLSSMTKLIKAARTLKVPKLRVIPLSEVDGCAEAKYSESVGVLGPLSNFIQCDRRIKSVINFLCGDTLLVSTQAIAYLVSSDGLRAVTLSGEVFEPLGRSFRYGFSEPSLSLMSEIETEEEILEISEASKKLREAIEKRKAELAGIETESRSLLKQRTKRIADVSSMKAEISTISKISSRYRSVFRSINQEYARQEKAVQKLEKKYSSLVQIRESITRALEALNSTLSSYKEMNLDGMLAELESSRVSIDSELSILRNRIAELNLSLSKEKANLENVLMRSLEENRLDLESAIEEYNSNKEFLRQAPKTIKDLQAQKENLESQIEKIKESSRKSQPVLDEFESRIKTLKEAREAVSKQLSSLDKELYVIRNQIENTREKLEELIGSLRMLGFSEELEFFEDSEVLLKEVEEEYYQISQRVNRSADKQYKEAYAQYKNLSVRYNELEKERNSIISFIESIEKEKKGVFMTAFNKIRDEFSTIFRKLTNGEAWLELEKEDEIFSGGMMLYAKLGTKPAWESSSLSGGEKAVAGVSLILAMQSIKKHPFYLFDEIDAALDAVNTSNLAEFLLERSNSSQIIAITLRDVLVAKSNITYGVYSTGGVSRIVHYRPAEVKA